MRRRALQGSTLVALLLLASGPATLTAAGSAGPRPSISLGLKPRAAYPYRHEYAVVVRVSDASSRRPLSPLQVVAAGSMDEPGHKMTAGPVRLRSTGSGTYRGAVDFYMAGEWRIRIAVKGRGVIATAKNFDVVLK